MVSGGLLPDGSARIKGEPLRTENHYVPSAPVKTPEAPSTDEAPASNGKSGYAPVFVNPTGDVCARRSMPGLLWRVHCSK